MKALLTLSQHTYHVLQAGLRGSQATKKRNSVSNRSCRNHPGKQEPVREARAAKKKMQHLNASGPSQRSG